MAEETLRRNLDSAFDPGPDFPHPLLLSRTIAILDAEDFLNIMKTVKQITP